MSTVKILDTGIRKEKCLKSERPPFVLLPHQEKVKNYFVNSPHRGLLLYHLLGSGKCHSFNTPIILNNGKTKMVQDIKVGDLLMGDDSTPRTVTSLARGEDEMYEIIPIKGDSYKVNQEHILCLKASGFPRFNNPNDNNNTNYNIQYIENNKFMSKTFSYKRNDKEDQEKKKIEAENFLKNISKDNIIEISVIDYLKLPNYKKEYLKTYRVPVDFPEQKVTIDPYMIGYWLGNSQIPIEYKDVKNENIPDIYIYNSRENRLKLLAGIIDNYGTLQNDCFEILYTFEKEKLFDNIIYLARSLGFLSYKTIEDNFFRIIINGKGIEDIPTKNKKAKYKCTEDVLVSGIKVKHIGRDNYYGFTLDGNCRYLLGDFTVTHNTCSAISIADELLNLGKVDKVYVCTPGSLRKNFVTEYCRLCGIDQTYLDKYYTFITYNTNIFESIQELDFNNSLVIIDEAHNLMNGAKNISKNPYSLYNQIFRSNARVLVLTATVIFNNTIEWCLIGNLLKDNTFPDIINGGKFDRSLTMHERNVFNEEKMSGIISYFPGYETDHPEVIHHKPIKVLLSLRSSSILDNIIDTENKQIAILRNKERKQGFLTPDERRELILLLKRIRSRSFSNINYQVLHLNKYKDYYFKLLKKRNLIELENRLKIMDVFKNYNLPHVIIKNIDKFIDKDDQKRIFNMLRELKVNIVYDIVQNCVEKCTKKYIKDQLDNQNFDIEDDELDEILALDIENVIIPDYQINKGGWISHDILHDKILNYACPKFVAIIVNILKNINTKQVVFSYFIKRGGLLFLNTLLNMCGIKSEIYSGEVSAEKRSQILDKFNSIENRDGKNIKVLLTTEAGCEGITMLEVEHVHILETNPNTNKTLQCIGRAARFRSHINLPKERQKVNIWKYHANIVAKQIPIRRNGSVIGYKVVKEGDDIDLRFLNTFKEYYDYYIDGGNIRLLNKVYGNDDNEVEISFGEGIDEILDVRSEENVVEYQEFYDILQKYSIERTGLIDTIPLKPLVSEPLIRKSNEEIIREIINNYKGDEIKKSEIKRILKIKNIQIEKEEFDKILEKIMNE